MTDEVQGKFLDSLVRNNKQIRKDRATAIAEDTELAYKRTVEDLELSLRKMQRDRENMLDLSPDDKNSLVLASKFNQHDFVRSDIELGVSIRNTEIKLEIARKQYQELFGAGV